ncbi:hypothetical protein Goe16_00370 [Bacillus phage vB_BsuM-Goe16]|nr:hypothetical protein Goe16_00370 [Bacillus phage vB_BsuM-Goe16]
MAFIKRNPFKVTVTKSNGELHVKVDPKPVAAKDEYLSVVTKTMQDVLLKEYGYGPGALSTLRKSMKESIDLLYKQGLIKPADEEMGD